MRGRPGGPHVPWRTVTMQDRVTVSMCNKPIVVDADYPRIQ